MAHLNIVVNLLLLIGLVTVCTGDLVADRVTISPIIKRLIGYPAENLQNFAEKASSKGYLTETHYVTTDDGYILMNFRIKSPDCKAYKSIPILLVHGVLLNSDCFLVSGEDEAIGYHLANQCYDVWALNNRGNNYSRNHTTLNPDTNSTFWDFSIDEWSVIDNAAVIDYILETTGAAKVHPVGYSLGGGTILITLAAKPEYNDKVGVIIGLAPAVTLRNTKSIIFAVGMRAGWALQDFLAELGIKELLYKESLLQTGLEFLCQFSLLSSVCETLMGTTDTLHAGSVSAYTIRRFFSVIPMGVSVKLIAQGQQWANTDELAPYKYDYGSEKNLEVYGSETPPAYDFTQVTAPVVMFNGAGDHIVVPESVTELAALIPNVTVITANDSLWNHIDMGYSKSNPTIIFPTVLEYLEKYNDS